MSYHVVLDNLSPESDWAIEASEKADQLNYASDVKERVEATAKVAQEVAEEFSHAYEKFNITLAGHIKQGDDDVFADTVNIAVSGILNPVEVLT